MKPRTLSLWTSISCLALLAATATAAEDEKARAAIAIGDSVPASTVEMRSVDGKDFSIAGVAGKKGTLVIFSCNSCPWVKAWEERMVAIGNACRKRGIGVIAINSNDPAVAPGDGYAAMQERAQQRGMRFPYVVDAGSDVARAFGATRTPEVFLFDGEGRLVYHGVIDDNAKEPRKVKQRYLEDAIEAMVGGREIAVRETKAFGCSIKFHAKT